MVNSCLETRFAVGAIIIYNEKYLLINKIRNNDVETNLPDEGIWDFVKGGIKQGETAKEALFRELQEELNTTDFKIIKEFKESLYFKFPNNKKNKYRDQITYLFLVEFMGNQNLIKIDNNEIGEFRFFTYQEVIDKLTHNETKNIFINLIDP